MAEEKKHYMTEEGKKKLEDELQHLITTRRKEVVERIKVARSFGDLSENSEYDSAKEDQAFIEGRISQLEKMIRNAIMIENQKVDGNIVSLGKTVRIIELPDGDEEEYTIVGSAESDPLEGKISNDSPLAQSLIGKTIKDRVVVNTPAGEMRIEILEIR